MTTYFIEMWDAANQTWRMQGKPFNAASDKEAKKEIRAVAKMRRGKTFQLVRKDDNHWLGYAHRPVEQVEDARKRA